MTGLRVAIAQINPHPQDIEGNTEKILSYISRAKENGADVVVFAETIITAYAIGDKHKDRTFIAQNKRTLLEKIAPHCNDIVVILGFIDFDDHKHMKDGFFARYNAYAVIQHGKIVGQGRKTILVDDGVLDDSRHYLPGSPDEVQPVRVTIRGKEHSLGVLICQDMWDDQETVKPAQLLKKRGAELLIVLNASPYYVEKLPVRIQVAQARVKETGLPLVYCNTVGVQDNGKNIIVFDGGSFALDASGAIAHTSPQFAEDLSVHTIGTHSHIAKNHGRIPQLHDALVFALHDFFTKTGVFRGAVIGLSGGIDSAIDACLLVEALGAQRVLCVNMPSRFNSSLTRSAAQQLAKNLGCEYLVHPIQEVIEKKIAEYVRVAGVQPKTLTVENMQARERGNILMTYAQERGAMVVGNGNKTEFQRGYATMYGDIIGALMPLGDVNKVDVYALAQYCNTRAKKQLIPEEIFTVVPSAELSDAQRVEDGKGDPFDYWIESPLGVEIVERFTSDEELADRFTRKILDPALWTADPAGKTVYDKLTLAQFMQAAHQTRTAISQSYFKRVQAPPIIIVSPRAFGFDYRETLFARRSR